MPSPQLGGGGIVVVVVDVEDVVVVGAVLLVAPMVVGGVVEVVVVGTGSHAQAELHRSPAPQPVTPSHPSPSPGSISPSPQPVERRPLTDEGGVFLALNLPVNAEQSVPSAPVSLTFLSVAHFGQVTATLVPRLVPFAFPFAVPQGPIETFLSVPMVMALIASPPNCSGPGIAKRPAHVGFGLASATLVTGEATPQSATARIMDEPRNMRPPMNSV